MKRALVIGSGFGGMAAALRARARGYAVTLVERHGQLGGRAMVYRRNGYTFDAGPTVVTAPFLFDELFDLFGNRRDEYVRFVPLYPWYRIVFADGRHFDYGGTLEQTLAEIRRFEPADEQGYLRLLEHTRKIYDVGFTELGDKPFESMGSMIRVAPQLVSLGAWRTVWQMACKYIKHPLLRRVFSFQPLLVGGNPFNTTSIYSLIHYLERQWGVHFAMGGTGSIVAALGKLMTEQGVDIQLNSEVDRIVVEDGLRRRGVVRGVHTVDGRNFDAEVVICNADAPWAHKHWIDARYRKRWTDRRLDRMRYSMGLYVLYFGTTRRYPDVQHHTIMLGESYRDLLRAIFDEKHLPEGDFSLYLHRPTATDPSLAPEGCESFYVLCPVPNLQGGVDWKTAAPRYRQLIVDHLEKTLLPDLSRHMVEEFSIDPTHFRDQLCTLHGTGFSIQPTFMQSAAFRFHNRSEDIDGLYFVGAAAHPGAGMPGVLSSAKVLDHVLPRA